MGAISCGACRIHFVFSLKNCASFPAQLAMEIDVSHIPGAQNVVADDLSRWDGIQQIPHGFSPHERFTIDLQSIWQVRRFHHLSFLKICLNPLDLTAIGYSLLHLLESPHVKIGVLGRVNSLIEKNLGINNHQGFNSPNNKICCDNPNWRDTNFQQVKKV